MTAKILYFFDCSAVELSTYETVAKSGDDCTNIRFKICPANMKHVETKI